MLAGAAERLRRACELSRAEANNAQALVVTPDGEVHESGRLNVSIRGFLDTFTKKRRVLATLAGSSGV